jgi:hypothetical protein
MKVLSLISRLYRPRLLKLILFLCFLVNLGIMSDLQSLSTSEGMSAEERMEKIVLLNEFISGKVDIARKKDTEGAYSPYDYFRDLREIFDKKRELGADTNIYNDLQEMGILTQKSLGKGFTGHDVVVAREEYKEYIDPARVPREQSNRHLSEIGWSGTLSWLLGVYLKSLILAFVLFLIWINEDKKDGKELFGLRNPASFAVALVLYPAVISCVSWQWLKHTGHVILVEAELRRTKKRLFTLLSEDELAWIKRFIRSGLPVSVWRRNLVGQGLTFRHGVVLALIVTIIMVIIPKPGEARTRDLSRAGPCFRTEQSLGHNLARMHVEEQEYEQSGDFPDRLIFGFQDVLPNLPVCLFRPVAEIFRVEETPKDIDHVPRGLFGLNRGFATN